MRIVIPNSQLLENKIFNWTLIDDEARTSVRVSVSYGSSVREVVALLEQAAREQDGVLTNPEPAVLLDDCGAHGMVFEVFFFTRFRRDASLRRLRSEVRYRIGDLFLENDIIFALPQKDVHIDGAIKIDK